MTKADVVKRKYNKHFEDLQKMRRELAELRTALDKIKTQTTKDLLESHIQNLEAEMADYAKELYEGGIDIIKRVA